MQISPIHTTKPTGYLISDIFNEAGEAFIRMGSLASSLKDNSNSSTANKWSQSDIDKFYNAVRRFSAELNVICTSLDDKVKDEIHTTVERNILMETGCISTETRNPLNWKSEESYDKTKKEAQPKSEEHSPEYIDPDDEVRDNYNSEEDNYDIE